MTTLAARGSGTPATTGTTWAALTNAVDGAAGTNPATYATMTNAVSGAVATMEITGYEFSSSIGASDTLNSVSVSLRHFENNTGRFATVRFQAFDGGTAIGTATTCTLATAARTDTATPAVTLAQLRSATFKIVVTITGAASTQSRVFSIDQVDVTADYTPLPPAITQAGYRFYADGTETGATALASQDTAHTADTSAGDVNLQLRVRLQTTNAVAVAATDDWQLQWEKNTSGTWTNVQSAGAEVLADTNPEANTNDYLVIANQATSLIGQSFLGNGQQLTRAGFKLLRAGSPTATIGAALYAHTGTFGSGLPTGSPLATSSTTYPASSVPLTTTWHYFTFDGTYTLTNGTPYFVILSGAATGDLSNQIRIDSDNTPSHAGNTSSNATGSFAVSVEELIFEVYTALLSTTVLPYVSANLTDAAATTNRLGAGTGSFVAGKVSEDGLVDDLGWTANNYTEALYSITLKQADLSPSDTLKFRVLRNGATTGLTYTTVPSVTIGTAGPTDRTGTATGSLTLVGTSSGQKEVTATAAGTLTLTGTAAGAPVTAPVLGTASGQLELTGLAVGVRPMAGTGVGTLEFTGTAVGVKTVGATAAGSLAVTGTALGVRETAGTAIGALTVAGTAVGVRTVAATAAGALTLTGSATGVTTAAPVLGQAAGSLAVVGATVGVRGITATAAGSVAVAGLASGQKIVTATSSGTLAVAGTAAGQKTVGATAVGMVTLAGTAAGSKTVTATATGALTLAGTAAGLRVAAGTATGAIALTGTAVGQRTATATAVGVITLAGTSSGTKTVSGAAAGQITITSSALGLVEGNAVGIGNGAISLTGTVTGVRDTKATATGALTVTGLASGTRGRLGVAVGAVTLTGLATGTKNVTALATGSISLAGSGVGSGVVSAVVGQWNTDDVVAYQWGADEVVEWFMVVAAETKTGNAVGTLTVTAAVAGVATSGALLLVDPCNDFITAPWTTAGSTAIAAAHTGNGFSFPSNVADEARYNLASGVQTDLMTVGAHIRFSTLPAVATQFMAFRSDAGVTNHISVRTASGGRIYVFRSTTQLALSAASLVTTAVWYFLEVSIKLHDTLGTVTVRLDGTPILSLTSEDTKNAGTKTVFDQLMFHGNTNTAYLLDNIYIRNDNTFGP